MKKLNLLKIIFLIILSNNLCYGQVIKLTTDKEKYEIGEKIELIVEINIKVDSVELLDFVKFQNFKLVSVPSKTYMNSKPIGEIRSHQYKLNYILRAEKIGVLKLESPEFFSNGEKINSVVKFIEITKSVLTSVELEHLEYKNFVNDPYKPNGTFLYNLSDKFGYIAKYHDSKLVFYRRLTDEEFKLLNDIK